VSVLGQIPALALLTAAALGLVVGPLADRFGHRPTLLAGVLASSLGAVATALAPSLLVLVPVALIGAGGRSIGQPVAQAIVGTRYVGPALRRSLSLVQATGTLAPIVGIPLVTAIGTLTGWRGAFVALGAMGFVAVGLMLWLLPPDRPAARAATRLSPAAFAPLLADRPSLWLYASALIRNVGVWALFTYLGGLPGPDAWAELGRGRLGVHGNGDRQLRGQRGDRRPTRADLAAHTGDCRASPDWRLPGRRHARPGHGGRGDRAADARFVANGVGVVSQSTLLVGGSPTGHATTTSLNQTCISLGGAIGSSVGGLLLAVGGFRASDC